MHKHGKKVINTSPGQMLSKIQHITIYFTFFGTPTLASQFCKCGEIFEDRISGEWRSHTKCLVRDMLEWKDFIIRKIKFKKEMIELDKI